MQTAHFKNDITGDSYIPEVFADDARLVVAGLDWVRAWTEHGNLAMVAQELRSVANAAESLAGACREWADIADENLTGDR